MQGWSQIMEKRQNWKLSSYIITLYVFLIFCIYPLYYEDGYYNMATAKCRFFLGVSVIVFLVLSFTAIIDSMIQRKSIHTVVERQKISVTEKLLYMYIIMVLLSFFFSAFKKNVLWGATDWYIGTVPLLLMTFYALFLMHVWREQKWIRRIFLAVSAAVFLLGICNRFSIYPISMAPKQAEFISTLGNINWICGYMSIVSPIGIGLWIFNENKKEKSKWKKLLLDIYVLIIFMLGFCQGSSSVFLWNGALFLVLFCILLKSTDGIKKWLLLVGMWGMSGQLVRVLKMVFPGKYNYDTILFVDSNVTLTVALAAIVIYMIIQFCCQKEKELPIFFRRVVCYSVLAVLIIVFFVWLMLAVYHTKFGISFLKDYPIFLLNENWGNGRGIIFKAAFELFHRMSSIQKLFGVGADGFSAYAYSIPEIEVYLKSHFGNSILTNAHCELLTNLINLGILGTVTYAGIFITFAVRCMKIGEQHPYAYIPAVCVICYFTNNILSFAQMLNIPFLFLILGMGEAYLRKIDENKVA